MVTIGQTVSHYRILEKLGSGGMGEVYRAHDERLNRDVALKVLPAGTLADETARSRFRREALTLSQLNHPNIAVVHDFDTENDMDFLAMEYVAGETLAAKIAAGPLPEKEVVALGTQIAEALEEAHGHGIIHRDLKPGNVMVTPKGRVKVLDFGLAKLVRPSEVDAATASLAETQTGAVMGTVPYMAPEQLRGEKADARTDLWGAGVVLYEMAAGRRPFAQTTAPLLISAILNQAPQPPVAINRQVSSRLQSVIVKALEKDPGHRYQSAHDLAADLERLATGAVPVAATQRRWARVTAVAGICVLLVGGFLLWHYVKQQKAPPSAAPKVQARRSVAVLGFKNLAGKPELAWFSTAISEMLITELAAGEQLRTVPGENVGQMKISLALPDADSYSKETLARIRQNLNADDVVLGSYIPVGDGQIRLDLRLQDAVAGETLASVSVKGSGSQLDELASKAGAELRAKLGVGGLSEAQSTAVKASLPSNPEAARLYAEGLAKLRVFDGRGARELLEKAVSKEPKFALAHSALAAAWTDLGYDEKAKEEAKKAFDLSSNLSREQHLSVEGRYRMATNEWDKAADVYHTLFNFFPDDLDYGLQLARAHSSAGNGKEALATIELLRKLPLPQRDDPRIDLAEAEALAPLGNFRRMEVLAAQAGSKGEASGAQLLVARARLDQCDALHAVGERKSGWTACEEAERIYSSAGDRRGVARILNRRAGGLYSRGDLVGAKKVYEQTLEVYREIGNKWGVAGTLDNIANVVGDMGDPAGANRLSRQALAIYREIGDDTEVGKTLNNIAAESLVQGDIANATKAFEEALAIWRKVGDKNGEATSLNNLAEMQLGQGQLSRAKSNYEKALAFFRATGVKKVSSYPLAGLAKILLAEGDLAGAEKGYEESLAISRESSAKHESALALAGLGSVLLESGDLGNARKRYEEALALRKEIGEKAYEAESLLVLADLTTEEGRPADAETPARTALEEFRREKMREDEVRAHSVIARSLLARGQVREAQKEIDLAVELARRSSDVEVRMDYGITAARVRAAGGGTTEAAKSLEATLGEATKYGYFGYQLEARLALGEKEMKSGKATVGRSQLEALEKDARARGFLLIARKAARAKG